MPRCASCGETHRSKFYKDRRRPDGYQTYCKECAKVKRAEWAKRNPSRIKDYYKEYYQGIKKDPRKWAERLRQESHQRARNHIVDQVLQNNRRAASMGSDGKLSPKAWYKMIINTDVCPGCKRKWVLVGKPHIDHIRPLILRGANTLENIQPLCKSCNSRKKVSIRRFVERKRGKAAGTPEGRD